MHEHPNNARLLTLSHAATETARLSRLAQLCCDSLRYYHEGKAELEPVYLSLEEVSKDLAELSLSLHGLPDNPWQHLFPFLSNKGGQS